MAAGDLTDLATVKAWLGVTTTGSDTQLTQLITAASVFVKQYLNSEVLSASYTETRKALGRDTLMVSEGPVTAVSSIAWSGQSPITAVADPVNDVSGILFAGRAISLVGYCFPHDWVKVTYTAGFAAIPPDIQQATTELVGEAFKRNDRIGQTSKSLGGQEVVAFSTADMNATIKAVLGPYRNVAPV